MSGIFLRTIRHAPLLKATRANRGEQPTLMQCHRIPGPGALPPRVEAHPPNLPHRRQTEPPAEPHVSQTPILTTVFHPDAASSLPGPQVLLPHLGPGVVCAGGGRQDLRIANQCALVQMLGISELVTCVPETSGAAVSECSLNLKWPV